MTIPTVTAPRNGTATPRDQLQFVLSHLGEHTERGGTFKARCPAHDDDRPSLDLAVKNDQFVMKCRAGCTNDEILQALRLSWRQIFRAGDAHTNHGATEPGGRPAEKRKAQLGRIVAAYAYHDEAGQMLYEAVRYEPKAFRQRRPDPDQPGKYLWNLNGVRLVPYRLPDLLAAPAGARVCVSEGEKDADRLRAIGFTATTNPMGAGKWGKLDKATVLRAFAGKTACVFEDNDEAGRRHTLDTAKCLYGVASEVRVVRLPGLLPKGDVSDWLDAGGTVEHLIQLIDQAPVYRPDAEGAYAEDDLPSILVGVDERAVNDAAIAALTAEPMLYQRGNMLVRVLRDETRTRRVFRPPGAPRISPLPDALLRETMAAKVRWFVTRKKSDGNEYVSPTHPPGWSVAGIAARGRWEGIRHLEAVVEAPTLRPDGTVIDKAGWDEATGLLYEPRIEFPTIPDSPTKAEAEAAAEKLLDLIREFPMVGADHYAAWLAGLLTPPARFAFNGPAPLFLISANAPGTGKTLLASMVSEINDGREMARTPYQSRDDEMTKVITSIALAGDRTILLDNIDTSTKLGCAALDAALTATSWKQRILGASQMTPDLPLFTVWFASGNNIGLRGDIHRRVIPVRLEAKEERPEERNSFKYPDLLQHIRANRAELVVAVLTVLRGYFAAECPTFNLPTFGSYEDWSRVVRNAVFYATGKDPYATREGIRDEDESLATLAGVIDGWSRLPGAASKEGVTVAEALRHLSADAVDAYRGLSDALMAWSKDGKLPSARAIGYKLRAFKGRIVGGRALRGEPDRDGIVRWHVATVGP